MITLGLFQEMLLVLDNYRHDFHALIDWINLQERLENPNDRYVMFFHLFAVEWNCYYK